ncbi:unnamed protein product [[Candida] boidinii]|nr:unnamed protein product [[Candida] boidinii]
MERLGGDGDCSTTCETWDGGGHGGHWGHHNDLWNGDWSSTGGDDRLGGDGDCSTACETCDSGGDVPDRGRYNQFNKSGRPI